MLGGFIVCGLAGLVCILLGYLIWVKKQLTLIAGYSQDTFKGDKEKLAKAVGLFTIIVGMLTILLPFALEFISTIFGIIFGIVVIFGSIGLLAYINKLNSK
ncbi:DUF3784 domain-containing protein [Fredinandcohnia humi]